MLARNSNCVFLFRFTVELNPISAVSSFSLNLEGLVAARVHVSAADWHHCNARSLIARERQPRVCNTFTQRGGHPTAPNCVCLSPHSFFFNDNETASKLLCNQIYFDRGDCHEARVLLDFIH